MATRSILAGCGAYLPDRVIDNNELAKLVDTSNDWIKQRTGIEKRHVVADGELTSDLAVKAADQALFPANIPANDIDLIIVPPQHRTEPFLQQPKSSGGPRDNERGCF